MSKFGNRLLIFILALVIGNSSFAAKPQVKKIEAKRDRGFYYLDIYTSGNTKAKGLLLEDKLAIDFPDAKISSKIPIKKYWKKSDYIKKIQTKQVNSKTARIIVYLKKPIDYDIVNVFGRNKTVIEIGERKGHSIRYMTKWEKTNLKKKTKALKPYKYKAAVAKKGKKLPLRGKVIVLDPGHGGRDPGAFSVNGIPEKRFTLAVAKKAAYLLKSAGATVYLTRNTDRTTNLRRVVNFANKIRPDLFISVHFNFTEKRSISGTETYYYNKRSRRLALIMHKTLLNGIKRKDRGLRRAKYYAIHHTKTPAILMEPAYISNWKESKLAASPKFQRELAYDILRGVKTYFRSKPG